MNGMRFVLAVAAAGVAFAARTEARNVDLATVPARESVQLTIYNGEDLTLVRETRSLSLKAGTNHIQYSWANTLIDPTSVEIRPLLKQDQIEVLDTTYPSDKPQQLVWNIESKFEGQVPFQVTYFTSGLSWAADYVLVANNGETEMSFDGNVQIFNNSGEDYENAQVRLVVGVVNLVEKIQELARRGLLAGQPMAKDELEKAKKEALVFSIEAVDGATWHGDNVYYQAPPEIIKEGLSEYFIYTIEGMQNIPNQTSKRLASFQARQVKFDILYRLRLHQYGPRPVRFFMLKNDEEHKLGTTPLPDGVVRTFRDNGRDGLCFLGQEQVKYVPIKADIELNVGTDDEVIEEYKAMAAQRSKFVFDKRRNVTGWDEKRSLRDEVRNYKAKPIRVEVRRVIDGDVTLEAEGAKLFDFHTVEFTFDIKPAEKFGWEYNYTQRNGTNAKQNAITLAANLK
jgi:hypothetical protein